MGDTSRSQTVSTKLQGIAEQAVRYPGMVFTTLMHLIDIDFLYVAYDLTRKDGATGLDGVTGKDYKVNLESNLQNLLSLLKSGKYKAPLIKRVWIEKEGGKDRRPIGITEFEDKVVQRAVAMILGAIYEQNFYDFSYGYREGRSPHQAIEELRNLLMSLNIRMIVDADLSGFFNNIDHAKLLEIIKVRVNDGGLLKLIGKWLKAGVVDGKSLMYPEMGTPQGGVISPILANIFLHTVLDEWFVKEVKPKMKGEAFLIRFADDFIVGCENEEDSVNFMSELPNRLQKFGLKLNLNKTKLIEFTWKNQKKGSKVGSIGTFDFLGFTHYWTKSRRGNWVIKRKTAKPKILRSSIAIWEWCRKHRHEKLRSQHKTLCSKLRGHYQYYGIRCNYKMLEVIYEKAKETWRYWLSQRGARKMIPWEKYENLLKLYPLPKPRIVHMI